VRSVPNTPSPTDIREIARQTLESVERGHQRLNIFSSRRNQLFDAVAGFRAVVRQIDPGAYAEDNFESVDRSLADVITVLQNHLTTNVQRSDVAQCMFLGDSIRDLREARYWIKQGYSPDPARRPSDDELRARAKAHAATSLTSLFA